MGPSLEQIGFDDVFQAQLAHLDGGLVPARIAIAHGESYVAWTSEGPCKATEVLGWCKCSMGGMRAGRRTPTGFLEA